MFELTELGPSYNFSQVLNRPWFPKIPVFEFRVANSPVFRQPKFIYLRETTFGYVD